MSDRNLLVVNLLTAMVNLLRGGLHTYRAHELFRPRNERGKRLPFQMIARYDCEPELSIRLTR